MPAPLSVALYFAGLIVFVPDSSENPKTMTAYLVNALEDDCAHEQLIWFPPQAVNCPNGCSVDGTLPLCKCPLGDSDVTLRPPANDHAGPLYAKSGEQEKRHEPLPDANSNLADFYYVIRLGNLEPGGAKIRQWAQISKLIGARVPSFGWDAAQSCFLDQGGDKAIIAHHFTFVDYSHSESMHKHRQALSKAVRFDLVLPDVRGNRTFDLVVGPKHTSNGPPLVTLQCTPQECPSIFVTNDIVDPDDPTCDGLVEGKHFMAYYGIVDSVERLIPRPLSLNARDWFKQKNNCPGFIFVDTSGEGRPICPMAIVDP